MPVLTVTVWCLAYTEHVIPASALLKAAGLPALFIADLVNIRYLTGLPMTAGLLVVLPTGYVLCVDARYTEAAAGVVGMRVCAPTDLPVLLKRVRRIGFESTCVTVDRLTRWQKQLPWVRFRPARAAVEDVRRVKSPVELRSLRIARRMTRAILARMPRELIAGITERQLANRIALLAHELGGDGLSFEPIVAFGTHTARPHHRPTDRRLGDRDIVQIDIGVRYRGYCADLSEVFFVGEPTAVQRRQLTLLRRTLRQAMAAARPGVDVRALDRLVRSRLAEAGLEQAFTHALGHGVGLDVHEGVVLSSRSPKTLLRSGEVLAIEPGIYFAGKYGMRVEDMKFVV